MVDNEGLLTVREVARRYGRSEATVRRWIWSGKLPARKLGNQLFVDPADLGDMSGRSRLREVQAPYKTERRTEMSETYETLRLPPDSVKYDVELMEGLMNRARRLRKRVFERAGYIDVAEAVRESREEH